MRKIDRFLSYLDYKGITENRATIECKLSQGLLHQAKSGKSDLGYKTIEKILDKYRDINRDWLLTGEGNMLKGDSTTEEHRHTPSPVDDSYRLVPMYNIDARGGFGTNDEVDCPEYVVDYIPFKDAKVDDICVSVVGNSMAPTYVSGSVVLLHRIEQWREFLELGQVYMIVLNDGRRLIKELRASRENRKENYLCVSHNPDFDPVELPKHMISHVFLVRAVYAKTSM